MIKPAVLYFHRKAYQRALRDDMVLHLTEATTVPGETVGRMEATILFVDLSGFTSMTQTLGDETAARIVDRFSELVRDGTVRWSGRVVKQIGDEFMLAFADPADAVPAGLAIDAAVEAETELDGVRIGAHHGPLLYREGDYIGTTVNIAARVTGLAQRHQFLVTAAITDALDDPDGDIDFLHLGGRDVKGISGELQIFEARRRSGSP